MMEIANLREMNALAWLRAEQTRLREQLFTTAVPQRPWLLRPALLSSTSARAITADFLARRRLEARGARRQ